MKKLYIYTFIVSLCFVFSGHAQNKLTGTVTNSKNKPIADAQIFLGSTNSGVTTNKEGQYSVDLKEGVTTINVFTYKYGLLSAEVEMEKVINFVYLDDKKRKRLKKNAGVALEYSETEDKYIAKNVPNAKLDKQINGYNNIYDMIRGRVAGVTVTGNTIRIRGANSIQSNSDPLLIVDGTPVFNINNIVPANVKNIKVIKGSDAAIYGTRGANGVIIITTKS